MHYYVEITCLPDEGVPAEFIMGKVMGVLHLAFVGLHRELGHNPVGISFPEYLCQANEQGRIETQIGGKIRLFSREPVHLEKLNISQPLERLADYVHVRRISSLDRPNLAFATFARVQPKSSRERLIRRQAKRSDQPEALLREQYQAFDEERLRLPFVHLRSHSNTQTFRLFIHRQPAEASTAWQFGTYGLSSTVAVPLF